MLRRLIWRPPWRPIPRRVSLYSTGLNSKDLRWEIQTAPAADLGLVWESILRADRNRALELRYDVYNRVRTSFGLQKPDWALGILGAIPDDLVRFTDYLFAIEALYHSGNWDRLEGLLVLIAASQPSLWEELFAWVLEQPGAPPALIALRTLGASALKMQVNLDNLSREKDLPIIQMLQTISVRFSSQELVDALEIISKDNMVLASFLASSLLKASNSAIISSTAPPKPNESLSVRIANELPGMIWRWKTHHLVASSKDLHLYMVFLVYMRRAEDALSAYDKWPKLHDVKLTDAVLLAAAAQSDYSRLQNTFNSIEKDPRLISKMGSGRYATVLRALGYVGNGDVLESIYKDVSTNRPNFLTRGLFHALIFSHGVRGDIDKVSKYYDVMVKRGITPVRTTFDLVLRAYRDSLDLRGALRFVGDEMIARYQLGLKNPEFTLLLSLCARRHDHESAAFIWQWGSSLLEPDLRSVNTWLNSLISANKFEEAWNTFKEVKAPDIVTLTIILAGVSRMGDPHLRMKELEHIKNKLELDGDDGWYVSKLSYLSEQNDVEKFEATLNEMKSQGIPPNASHYALYTELLAKTKQFSKAQKIADEMNRDLVPLNYSFIEKHFRLLTSPGTTESSRRAAEHASNRLVKDGFFDPGAAMVPRGVLPVRIFKPVIRRLLKQGQFSGAKNLLDNLRKARANQPAVGDEHSLWALYMEVAFASHNLSLVEKLWNEFVRTLSRVMVLAKPSAGPGQSPVFKVARRHRFTFWRQINIRIHSLGEQKNVESLIGLQDFLDNLGLAMNDKNYNTLILALLNAGELSQAFRIANETRPRIALSGSVKRALASHIHEVPYRKYGELGLRLRRIAHNMTQNVNSSG